MIYKTRDDIVKDVLDAILEGLQYWEEEERNLESQVIIDDLERFAVFYYEYINLDDEEGRRREAIERTGLIAHSPDIMRELGEHLLNPWGDALLDPVAFDNSLRSMVFADALWLAKCRIF